MNTNKFVEVEYNPKTMGNLKEGQWVKLQRGADEAEAIVIELTPDRACFEIVSF